MDVFEFRKQLYLISNHLSSEEVKTLVFVCGSIIPRRQQEKIRTGFELFCILSEKKKISPRDVQFLTQILDSVEKSYLTQPLLERGGGRGVQEVCEWRTPPVEAQRIEYDTVGLEASFNVMLVDVADELNDRNVRDIALFFFDPDRSFGLQEVERLRSARDLFTILKDSRVISFTDLQKLEFVLEVLGRHDACRKIEAYVKQTKAFIKTPSTSFQGVQGHVPPGEHYSSDSAANPTDSQISGFSVDTTSLMSGGSGGPPTSLHSDFPGTQPSTHAPQTLQGDNGKAVYVYSDQMRHIDKYDGEPMDSTSRS